MATVATLQRRTLVGSFYVTMAAIFAAIAFSGFFMTYWLEVARGTFTASPMLHLHGLLFSLWTLFFLSQAVLITGILLFAGLVTAAIFNLKRPEWHKRLMLVATAGILQAAVARFVFLAATGGGGPGMWPGIGPPNAVENTMVPGVIVLSLVAAAMIHDWRSYGRVHSAYWWGFGAMMTVQLMRPLLDNTEAWYRFTDFLIRS